MSDFTHSSAVFNFYSAVWTRMFADTQVVAGIADAQALQMVQAYQDFIETVNRVSTRKIPVFHRELLYPLIINRSSFSTTTERLRFGSGFVFGAQPADTRFKEGVTFQFGGYEQRSSLFYFDLPENVKGVGNVIVNRLFAPSVMLARGADFTLDEGVIAFLKDPFENPLIPKRVVPGPDGEPDEQIVLWLTNVDIEEQNLFRQFGFIFSQFTASGEDYRLAIEYVIKAFAGGPSIGILDTLVATLAGAPVIAEARETVQGIETFKGKRLVFTDLSVYEIPADAELRSKVTPGTVMLAGEPLTLITEVIDLTTDSSWWRRVPGVTLGASFFSYGIKSIGFLNTSSAVTVTGQIDPEDNDTRLAEFQVVGTQADTKAFWQHVNTQSAEQGVYFAPRIWTRARAVDGNGNPDYAIGVTVNPLQFLVEEMIGTNLLVVRITANNLKGVGRFLGNITLLKEATPAHMAVLIFLEIRAEDSVSFYSSEGVAQTTVDLQDTADLLNQDVASFSTETRDAWTGDSTAEALSMDYGTEILAESLDLGNSSILIESLKVTSLESCAP